MNFHSIHYIYFLLIGITFYYFCHKKIKLQLLCLLSIYFIFTNSYWAIIAVSIISAINYFLIKKIESTKYQTIIAFFGVVFNAISILLFNFYASDLQGSYQGMEDGSFLTSQFIFFIGISYYTIQHIQLILDYKNGKYIPNLRFTEFYLSSIFFPKIIAGPIQDTKDLVLQFRNLELDKELFISGINRFLLGLLKKIIIADRIGMSVHSLFDYKDEKSGLLLIAAGFLFTIQLYFDFSAYCDMAIGSARLLGIRLTENFNLPIRSLSISEFWRKWHISLMQFINRNVYSPLSYSFRNLKLTGVIVSLLLTFFISGIWHGIGIGFILWAMCHATYMIIEFLWGNLTTKSTHKSNFIFNPIKWIVTFLLISFSNIFFRSENNNQVFFHWKSFFSNSFLPSDWLSNFWAVIASGGNIPDYTYLCLSFLFFILYLIFEKRMNSLGNAKTFKWTYILFIVVLILFFGVFDKGERFIYMQF